MSAENYYLLDDMEKHYKNFVRANYENLKVQDIIPIFRDYYKNNLPVDLLTWCRVNEPSDEMIYKNGYWKQIIFIRDTIGYLLNETYEEYKENPVLVINTHRSKSIVLPVYQLNLKKYGITMILRYNFYDWKVSVISENELEMDFKGVFTEDKPINSIYCEGFLENQVFGKFSDNKKNFTVEIYDDNRLYVFMYLLKDYLKNR
jgi:hypothetical protein